MARHRIEFPHGLHPDHVCPRCGHRPSRAHLRHPETGAIVARGDQFHVKGVEGDAPEEALAHLFWLLAEHAAGREALQFVCPQCEHSDHPAAFGIAPEHLEAL